MRGERGIGSEVTLRISTGGASSSCQRVGQMRSRVLLTYEPIQMELITVQET